MHHQLSRSLQGSLHARDLNSEVSKHSETVILNASLQSMEKKERRRSFHPPWITIVHWFTLIHSRKCGSRWNQGKTRMSLSREQCRLTKNQLNMLIAFTRLTSLTFVLIILETYTQPIESEQFKKDMVHKLFVFYYWINIGHWCFISLLIQKWFWFLAISISCRFFGINILCL